jgi:predicted PurR-regulated permease PerM
VTAPTKTTEPVASPGLRSEPERLTAGKVMRSVPFSTTARWLIIVAALILATVFIWRIRSILTPFVWAVLAAYVMTPIVNFVNVKLKVPRFFVVLVLYMVVFCALIVASRSLVPWLSNQITFFIQDLPKLQGSLISKVGPHPLGIDIGKVIAQLESNLKTLSGNPKNQTKLLTSAFDTTLRILVFLFSTFYLLMDGPRIRKQMQRLVPLAYRDEIFRLAGQINSTWMQYLRGELILFGIMSVASFIGLEALQVPGALPLAVATGLLELLPIVGPVTAGALAVTVAYLNGSNPFGWSQVTYGVVVALMYLAFRETEDYIVVPRVLGHAVKLHPLVVLFALASGGVIAGLLGLLIAVPIAASIKIVGAYLYDKLVPQPPQFVDVHAVGVDDP